MKKICEKWVDFTDPTEEELTNYSFDELDEYTLMDCLEPNHLPKKENLKKFSFVILRYFEKKTRILASSIQEMSEQIAIFYNNDIIITVHRSKCPFIDIIKKEDIDTEDISEPREIVTKIMYNVLKSYNGISLTLSTKIDKIEKQFFIENDTNTSLKELYFLKNACRLYRKVITLNGEVINSHNTIECDISPLQDVKDYQKTLLHTFDECYEDANNLSNMYLSIVSLKTNDVMRVLTIFSAFFMPLTFIVGLYGMNFKFMPEINWIYGYPFVLFLMVVVCIVIWKWFKKKQII
ncbi:hypothetical protein M0Q50_08240 [bacterium]|jgi:magnesium transporter|nr:hypothetical protein [bacterium]